MLSPLRFPNTAHYHQAEMHQRSVSSKKTGDMLFQEAILRVFHGGRARKCIISPVQLCSDSYTRKILAATDSTGADRSRAINLLNLLDAACWGRS